MKITQNNQDFSPPNMARILGDLDLFLGHFLGELYRSGPLKASIQRSIEARLMSHKRYSSGPFAPMSSSELIKQGDKLPLFPVVFPGAAKEWRCTQNWSDEYLLRYTQDDPVLFIDPAGISRKKLNPPYKIANLHHYLKAKKTRDYLRFSPIARENEVLYSDINWQWLDQWIDGGSRGVQLFMGRLGDGTLLHNDQPSNFTIQVRGQKKWRIFHPAWSCLFSPPADRTVYLRTQVDAFADSITQLWEQYGLVGWEITLNEGDILYNPPFFWHQVENLSDSISLSCQWTTPSRAWSSSATQLLLRLFSTNPPIWKTMEYSKRDVNLIFAHFSNQKEAISKMVKKKVD